MPDRNKGKRDNPDQGDFQRQGSQPGQSGYEGQKSTSGSEQPRRGGNRDIGEGNRGDDQQFDRNR